jgi:hypothetical protein
MGQLRPLAKAPPKIRREYRGVAYDDEQYLCGNCYFDLTDV